MPRLSQWFVRAALVYLLLGFTAGALLLANKGVPLHPALWSWLPAHIELLLVGWVLQLTLGVAFWIFPRFWEVRGRGDERPIYVTLILLNLGIWLVVGGSVFNGPIWLLLAGRVSEVVAVVLFALAVWGRIVGREG